MGHSLLRSTSSTSQDPETTVSHGQGLIFSNGFSEILIGSLHLVGHQVAHATSSVGCGAIGVNLDHLVQPNDGDFPISIGERFPGTIVVGT
jgi:hypothetical protein